RAQVLHTYLENPESFLWTILVGNTLANLVIVALGVLLIFQSLGPWPVLVALALLAGLVTFYAFCELLPKTLFQLYPNRLCMYVAPSFRLMFLLLAPVVSLVTLGADSLLRWTGGRRFTGRLFGSRDELRRLMQESAQGFTGEERTMINRVLDLQNFTLRQIATPMNKVVAVSVETPVGELLAIFRERGFNRLPVWKQEGGRQRVVGLITLGRLVFEQKTEETRKAGDYVKPALYFDQDTRLEVALREMQRKAQRLAIVLDHNRTECGIISLQDILKFIFGEVSL
ncbi:MAG TPA: CNNM domain-containing protein, partial [Bacillota bacterium]|nr:CNNM domain-containing protein [Bacillota bacterium]